MNEDLDYNKFLKYYGEAIKKVAGLNLHDDAEEMMGAFIGALENNTDMSKERIHKLAIFAVGTMRATKNRDFDELTDVESEYFK